MKLNEQHKQVQSAGMNLKVDFNIEMNGKAFSVLSKDMYSNIFGTIVRELSSNAQDAHIAAEKAGDDGKSQVPFQVSCPTAFDPHFSVKDWGTGLRYYKFDATIVNEHEGESTIFINGDIRNQVDGINTVVINECDTESIGAILYDNTHDRTVIRIAGDYTGKGVSVEFDDTLVLYSTYFRSTKEQSNDFTGAFGLGSKTPLAYTDNFIVINRFNGIMRIYNIMTNEHGMPQINLMDTVETDEDNGLEVQIAVAPEDYQEFKDAIVDELMYFDPLPNVQNDKVEFPKIAHRGEHFLLFEDRDRIWGKGYACVGNNAYRINYLSSPLFLENMVIRFDIGEVMVTASREDLQYDDDTITMIQLREEQAMEEYTSYVLDSIDDADMTDYEKAIFLNNNHSVVDLSSQKVKDMVGNPNFRYSKSSITLPLTGWGDYTKLKWVDIDDGQGGTKTVLSSHGHYRQHKLRWSDYSGYTGKTSRKNGDLKISPAQEELVVFIRDNSYSFLKKIRYYLEENELQSSQVFTLDAYDEESMQMLKEVAGDKLHMVLLSSIVLPKNISTVAYGSYTTPVARMFDPSKHHIDGVKYWTDVYTPLTKIDTDAYIIKTHRCNIEDLDSDDRWFLKRYLETDMEFDADNTVILALSRTRYEKALSYGFKPVQELIGELREQVKIPVGLMNRRKLQDAYTRIYQSKAVSRVKDLPKDFIDMLNEGHPIRTMIRFSELFHKRYERDSRYPAYELLVQYMDEDALPEASKFVSGMVDNVNEMMDNIDSRLTLVEHLSAPWYDNEEKRQYRQGLIDYVNIMISTGEDNE